MPTKPSSVNDYLRSLPDDRREAVEAIRATINKNLNKGFQEGIQYSMIGWSVPHSVYPNGYHCDPKQPLPFASVASQKNHIGIYLFCLYCDAGEQERFVKEWKATGKRLDMGKSCIRVKKLEDVPLEVLGRAIKRVTAKRFIAAYEAGLGASAGKPKASSSAKVTKAKVAKKTKSSSKKTAKKVGKATTKKAPKRSGSTGATSKRSRASG